MFECPVPDGVIREITILNNHSNFSIPIDLVDKIAVIDNQGRADWSTGHLSRSWNQGLIHGFRSLREPDADIVILCQNDAEFNADYLPVIIDRHQRYDITTHGQGDNCVTYSAAGVRQVGLWDERFCNIAHQEGDYFLRARKYLGQRASINDPQHGRFHNPEGAITRALPTGHARREASHLASTPYHPLAEKVFASKWANMTSPMFWNGVNNNPDTAELKADQYMYYPYFEHDVATLKEQRYVHLEQVGAPEPADRRY
jgi:hypothetical protein